MSPVQNWLDGLVRPSKLGAEGEVTLVAGTNQRHLGNIG